MTVQERIDSWKCAWGKDRVKLRLTDKIDWEKYGFKNAEVSINNNDNFVLIKVGYHSILNIDLSSSYRYIIELRSDDLSTTCGTKVPEAVESKLPIFYGYTRILYNASGIYELDKNNGGINFHETKQSDYIGNYLPDELRSIFNNPLSILDDEELSTFIPTVTELFHLNGDEVLRNAQLIIDDCINRLEKNFKEIRMINNKPSNIIADSTFLNIIRNTIVNYATSLKE